MSSASPTRRHPGYLLLRLRRGRRSDADVELRDEQMMMLLAGHEATATGLAFASDLLMRELRVLSRLRDELGGEGDTYLDAVVTESLRLRPVIDANERTLTKPRTICGRDLPPGIRVYPAIVVVRLASVHAMQARSMLVRSAVMPFVMRSGDRWR